MKRGNLYAHYRQATLLTILRLSGDTRVSSCVANDPASHVAPTKNHAFILMVYGRATA